MTADNTAPTTRDGAKVDALDPRHHFMDTSPRQRAALIISKHMAARTSWNALEDTLDELESARLLAVLGAVTGTPDTEDREQEIYVRITNLMMRNGLPARLSINQCDAVSDFISSLAAVTGTPEPNEVTLSFTKAEVMHLAADLQGLGSMIGPRLHAARKVVAAANALLDEIDTEQSLGRVGGEANHEQ